MAVPRRHRTHLLQAKTHNFLPVEGKPASLGPGLRTVSGANMETRSNVCHRVPIHAMTKDSKFSDLQRRMAAIEQELHERTDNRASDAMFTSPCLGWRDVSPCGATVEFWISHYMTVFCPSGGTGGFRSVNFNAFKTRRASGQPPLTPRRSG
jgi:hypothetical protein